MDRETALNILREHQAELRERVVKSLALFGSVARGEATEESDLDLLVEFDHPIGLFDFIRVKAFLEGIIGRRVDLVTEDALRPNLRERILEDVVYVS